MQTLVIEQAPWLKNLYLRNLSSELKAIKLDTVANLKYFEAFLESPLTCYELERCAESPYNFQFGAKGEYPPLKYFKSMIKFPQGAPRLAGLKWRQGHSPYYFSNTFEGNIQSKNVLHSIFSFISRAIRKDLYENRYLSLQEKKASEPFMSKRSDIFFAPNRHYISHNASL